MSVIDWSNAVKEELRHGEPDATTIDGWSQYRAPNLDYVRPGKTDEFKGSYWVQGRLVPTKEFQALTAPEREWMDRLERSKAYAEGGDSVLICIYGSPEECADAVDAHNARLFSRMILGSQSECGKEGE